MTQTQPCSMRTLDLLVTYRVDRLNLTAAWYSEHGGRDSLSIPVKLVAKPEPNCSQPRAEDLTFPASGAAMLPRPICGSLNHKCSEGSSTRRHRKQADAYLHIGYPHIPVSPSPLSHSPLFAHPPHTPRPGVHTYILRLTDAIHHHSTY